MNSSFDITRLDVTGAWPPPEGVTPNFIDPPSIASQVAPLRIAFASAATFFVILRIYTRGVLIRSLGIDDGMELSRIFLALAYYSIQLLL
jgi:hypothetical protein